MTEIHDDVFSSDLVAEAVRSWPALGWSHWLSYDSPLERKRTCCLWPVIPEPCRRLLAEMAVWAMTQRPGMLPDMSLYGSGMCDMREGDFLSLHLDHDRHPHLGLRRAVNTVLFLGECEGGELELWDRGKVGPTLSILPQSGRVVLFEPDVPHAVASVRGSVPRRALSVYLYAPPWLPPGEALRPRAQFLGENDGLEDLRAERASRGIGDNSGVAAERQ